MSVETRTDECIERSKNNINEAIENLSEIFVDNCDGCDSLDGEYESKLKDIFFRLIDIKRDFK